MDKNKQSKKRKLKTKLISIAMLAIILVTMLSVPTSAVETESVIGIWVFNDTLTPVTTNLYQPGGLGVEGVYYWYDAENDSVTEAPLGWFQVAGTTTAQIRFNATYDGNGGTGGGSGYPQVSIYSGYVDTFTTPNNFKKLYPTSSEITAEEYTLLRTVEFTAEPDGTDAEAFKVWLVENAIKVIPPTPEPDPLGNIFDVFLGIGGWIATAVTSLIGIFYSVEAGKLTVIGVLSVASLAISVIFLLIGVIQNFMHFRS